MPCDVVGGSFQRHGYPLRPTHAPGTAAALSFLRRRGWLLLRCFGARALAPFAVRLSLGLAVGLSMIVRMVRY